MMRFGSKNAYCARSNDTPCLRRLTLSFASSHSKLGALAMVWHNYHGFIWCTRHWAKWLVVTYSRGGALIGNSRDWPRAQNRPHAVFGCSASQGDFARPTALLSDERR